MGGGQGVSIKMNPSELNFKCFRTNFKVMCKSKSLETL